MERLFAGLTERAPTVDVTYSFRELSKFFVKLFFSFLTVLKSKQKQRIHLPTKQKTCLFAVTGPPPPSQLCFIETSPADG